jgi:hypothetical protein
MTAEIRQNDLRFIRTSARNLSVRNVCVCGQKRPHRILYLSLLILDSVATHLSGQVSCQLRITTKLSSLQSERLNPARSLSQFLNRSVLSSQFWDRRIESFLRFSIFYQVACPFDGSSHRQVRRKRASRCKKIICEAGEKSSKESRSNLFARRQIPPSRKTGVAISRPRPFLILGA